MNKLFVMLIAGSLTVVSSSVLGQAATTPMTPKERGAAAAYQNPAAEQTQAQKSKEAMSAAEKAKLDAKAAKPNVRDPDTLKRAQALSSSGTNPTEAKANVDASKKTARQKPKKVKDMTPEERAGWQQQFKEQSKP